MKKLFKYIFFIVSIPLIYLGIAFLFTFITVNDNQDTGNNTIYLSTNGVHLDFILSKSDIDIDLLNQIKHSGNETYFSFGWGDENFYLNTPTWGDLTFSTAVKAMFLNSPTLMHITKYNDIREKWIKIKISKEELKSINVYLKNSFAKDKNGNIVILKNKGYSTNDDFYKAKGSYSALKTCNTWVNSAFKESGLKACFWTPFDFGLINKYK